MRRACSSPRYSDDAGSAGYVAVRCLQPAPNVKSDDRTSTAYDAPSPASQPSAPPAPMSPRVEQAMLEILNRAVPDASDDVLRRERELRGLFLALDANQAHELIRRFDTSDDPLAQAFRRFIRRRR